MGLELTCIIQAVVAFSFITECLLWFLETFAPKNLDHYYTVILVLATGLEAGRSQATTQRVQGQPGLYKA